MNHPSILRRWLAALALAVVLPAGWAVDGGPTTTASPTGVSGPARVIVKFKADASALRRGILSAGPLAVPGGESAVAEAMQRRAEGIGQRHGIALRAGRVVDDRAQVVMADGITSAELARQLSADSDVEYAVVDERRHKLVVPNDPIYTAGPPGTGPDVGQWYLKPPSGDVKASIDAQTAWDIPNITTASANVVVGVLDTGVRYDHRDLASKLLPGYDMIHDATVANDGDARDANAEDPGDFVTNAEVNDPNSPFYHCNQPDPSGNYSADSSSWHGTRVAGIIGASTNNGDGIAGVGWGVRILPVRVLGKCFGYDSDIIAGMRWAAGLSVDPSIPSNPTPARVLNLSLGSSGSCTAAYADAINALKGVGAVVVAAAGNSAGHAVGAPANCAGVIGVVALRHIGTKVGFSDLGSEITIAAPGGNCVNLTGPCLYPIATTVNSGTTTPVSDANGGSIYTDSLNPSVGTSFSAPLVSGTVALMLAANSSLSVNQIISTLKSTARPFPTTAPTDAETTTLGQCHAPDGADQLQCFCTTSTCGAGMLDTNAAVRAGATLPPEPPPSTGGGGGGATSLMWLGGLAGATLLLRRRPRGRAARA